MRCANLSARSRLGSSGTPESLSPGRPGLLTYLPAGRPARLSVQDDPSFRVDPTDLSEFPSGPDPAFFPSCRAGPVRGRSARVAAAPARPSPLLDASRAFPSTLSRRPAPSRTPRRTFQATRGDALDPRPVLTEGERERGGGGGTISLHLDEKRERQSLSGRGDRTKRSKRSK